MRKKYEDYFRVIMRILLEKNFYFIFIIIFVANETTNKALKISLSYEIKEMKQKENESTHNKLACMRLQMCVACVRYGSLFLCARSFSSLVHLRLCGLHYKGKRNKSCNRLLCMIADDERSTRR